MNRVFVDTSAFVALFDRDDALHSDSKRQLEEIRKKKIRMIVTDYVLNESITTVMARAGHRTAVMAGEFILSSRVIDFVWLNETVKSRAWEFFKKHSDKQYSFTDCTSFVLMKDMKVNHFFAFDEHFIKAGFSYFSR